MIRSVAINILGCLVKKTAEKTDWTGSIETRAQLMEKWRAELPALEQLAESRFYVRVGSAGYRLISLSEENPCGRLRRKGNKTVIGYTQDVATAIRNADVAEDPGKPGIGKLEHGMQAALIRHALKNRLDLHGLCDGFDDVFDELIFVTDELSAGSIRADIIALGGSRGRYFPVFIELKAARALGRLTEQLTNAKETMKTAGDSFLDLLANATGKPKSAISFDNAQLLIVWPDLPSRKERSMVSKARLGGYLIAAYKEQRIVREPMGLDVTLTIHRAANEIGGNCIELSAADGSRILLDAGRPLDAPEGVCEGLIPSTLDVSRPVNGVLLSHPHQDHYGLLDELPPEWPVHCGKASEMLIRLTSGIFDRTPKQAFLNWQSGQPISLGPFTVTPLLTDHSAFDAYMLLIEVGGKRLLYSGDFRMHGRKSALVKRLMESPPAPVDALVMEGTNLGSNKPCSSETDLEDRFIKLFKETSGRVFVAWSAQNIDRTVTLYRACKRAERTLVVDLYTAEVMEMVGDFANVPRPGWPNIKVVITKSFARMYRNTGRAEFVDRMVKHGISADKLAATPSQWVVMTRPSLIRDFEKKGVVPNRQDAWSWSMWHGYLSNEDGGKVQKWFDQGQCPAAHIHTSGHASPDDLRQFATAIAPQSLIPVHGVAWDAEGMGFPPIRRLADGEPFKL